MFRSKIGSGRVKKVVVATIEPENDLLASLAEIANREGIKAGIILSAVGSLRKANLRNLKRFPKVPVIPEDLEECRSYKTFEGGPFEILSISGDVSQMNGEVNIHAHIILSAVIDDQIVVVGGHLIEGNIASLMVEVSIAELEGVEMKRTVNPERRLWELTFL